MSQEELLEFLRKYLSEPELLDLEDLTKEQRGILPESWVEILSVKGDERVEAALDCWGRFEDEFEQLLEYLELSLVSVDLLHHGVGYTLLYGIRTANGSKILYYEGRNPRTKDIPLAVAEVWEALPGELRSFYDLLHNGWYDLASGSMGLSPVEDFFFLGDEEWGILEQIGEPPVDLSRTLAVYASGMGGYVCFEIKDDSLQCLLWRSDREPRLDLDFWPVVDSWTVMGFEE